MLKFIFMAAITFSAEQGAHSHGVGRLSIAFDGKQGTLELHVPADSIYGFEREARSAQDKKKKEQGLLKLEEQMKDMVVFESSLKCEIKKDIFEVNQKNSHADIEAIFSVNCDKSPKETTMTFSFQKIFPRLKVVNVEVLIGDLQKSETVKKNGTVIELK